MLAVGAMTYVLGDTFARYLERLWPRIDVGVRNHKEWQVGSWK